MSTLEEALATRNRLSEYHVYHEGEEHICITPFLDLKKELGYNKKKDADRTNDYARSHQRSDESNSYFIHRPVLLFHDTPRTLRRGSQKNGDPLCIINSSAFWREWSIQFVPNLSDIMDPRGVVGWEYRTKPDNSTSNDERALKGHKVRSWRVWGETGKRYHRMVNARRKQLEEENFQPARADEVVKLKWSSPFINPRRYHFRYAGITFFWEGTRDLHENEKWSRRLLPLHHLKLVAEIPGKQRLFLAQFTSDFSSKKFGKLWVFDSAVSKLLETVDRFQGTDDSEFELGVKSRTFFTDIRETRVYELIMATAMCMVVGEWQKRLTLWFILILIGESGRGMNMAGAGGGGC